MDVRARLDSVKERRKALEAKLELAKIYVETQQLRSELYDTVIESGILDTTKDV